MLSNYKIRINLPFPSQPNLLKNELEIMGLNQENVVVVTSFFLLVFVIKLDY